MADTNLPVTPGSGTNVDGYSLDNGNFRQSVVLGSSTTAATVAPVDAVKGLTVLAYQIPSDQAQSVTGTTGAAVTVTLAGVASNFHYISLIEITKYFTVANAASATPLVITTTNLPNSFSWSFGQPLGTVGTTDVRIFTPATPMKSSAAGTSTTIVCPATTGIIWRVNVSYYVAP